VSTKIEEVARAIMEDSGGGRDRPDFNWRYYESAARAAIEAMREPTEAMRRECDGWNASPNDMEGCYSAMIDAALKEEPKP
jgi:hypothetical protein